MSLVERDREFIWHPFTQEKIADLPIAITHAKGSYLYDEDNKKYLDLVSSWWVNLHGHAHPDIARAIYQQALKLEHVIFAGFTHEPAVKLCELLSKILPTNLSKFFFSDNGSSSVEVALKMAYQYWFNQGEVERKLFLSFEGGYHGDTFGAMSVGAKSGFHDNFRNFFFKILTVPFPATWDEDFDLELKEINALEVLEQHLKLYNKEIAAMILEPLVQGARGMRMCRAQFVRKVVKLVRSYGILVIYDEVMTGFGRTGTIFALDQIGVSPDFLCISKGITGGFLPLALTVTTKDIYNCFLSDDVNHAFAHGHSYTANPLACAASIASLELLVNSHTKAAISNINRIHQEGMLSLKNHCSDIKNTRVLGTIAALEVEKTFHPNLNRALKSEFLERGILIRPLNNTIYILPPYSITESELEAAYDSIKEVINLL